jgi:hypothetical protein
MLLAVLSVRHVGSVDGHPDPGQFDQESVADGAGMQKVARLGVTA